MKEIIFEVREDETEGGFVARALGQSIVTQADTWEELRTNVRDAVRCHFEEGQPEISQPQRGWSSARNIVAS
jgi:hypothetical protein